MASHSFINTRNSYLKYPSPFLDIASTYTPATMKEMFRWTRYFYYSSSIMSPIVYKLSEYPVTGLIYNGKSKEKVKHILERAIRIKTKMVEINLDYHVFGNSFVSIYYPQQRFLKCPSCQEKFPIKKVKYEWKRLKFVAVCDKCKKKGDFEIVDEKIKKKDDVRLIRWSPFNIDIEWNPVTDEHVYTYTLPGKIRKAIISGSKTYIESMPKIFLDSVAKNKPIQLDNKNLYHFKRPNIADQDMGWGMPVILPVLKDVFFLNILRKGNEAISLGHIVPWRIIFPSSNSSADPYVNSDLGSWKSSVENEVKKWRKDPNHVSVMPLPAGFQSWGGDAKMLMTTNEEKLVQQTIAGGVGVPLELLFGTMSWSGSSVTLRILENHFITSRELHDSFLQEFLVPKISQYFDISEEVKVTQKNFKMADDIQVKNLISNLTSAGKISTTDFLDELGFDYEKQLQKISQEIDQEFEINAKRVRYQTISQNMATRLQIIAQKRMENEDAKFGDLGGEQGQPGQEGQPSGQQGQQQDGSQAEGGSPQAGQAQQGTQQSDEYANAGNVQVSGDHARRVQADVDNGMIDLRSLIVYWAGNLAKLPEGDRTQALQRMAKTNPETAAAVKREIAQLLKGTEGEGQQVQTLPEQRPPRGKAAGI